jgi:predicted nucleic acid-binding protein
MSKVRHPRLKKQLSLARDCRNAYGESPHGSRKAIPKHQAIRRRQERRVAAVLLSALPVDVDAIDNAVKARMRTKRLGGFRKVPDISLGQIIEHARFYRKLRGMFNEA